MSSSEPTTASRTHCQNCDTELQGPYCHKCGQHDFDFHQSFKHVLHELLESFYHFDGKFFQGMRDLLMRPGWLTLRFNSGKRASQIPPLRFYIFVSLLFFVISPLFTHKTQKQEDAIAPKAEFVTGEKDKQVVTDSAQISIPGHPRLEKWAKNAIDRHGTIAEHTLHYLPNTILVCLPLFALLTRVVFRKTGLNYLQHLIFGLHVHSFFFLLFSLLSVLNWIIGFFAPSVVDYLSFAGYVYLVVYVYLAIFCVFGGSRKGIILRSLFVLMAYAMILLTAVFTSMVIAALLA